MHPFRPLQSGRNGSCPALSGQCQYFYVHVKHVSSGSTHTERVNSSHCGGVAMGRAQHGQAYYVSVLDKHVYGSCPAHNGQSQYACAQWIAPGTQRAILVCLHARQARQPRLYAHRVRQFKPLQWVRNGSCPARASLLCLRARQARLWLMPSTPRAISICLRANGSCPALSGQS